MQCPSNRPLMYHIYPKDSGNWILKGRFSNGCCEEIDKLGEMSYRCLLENSGFLVSVPGSSWLGMWRQCLSRKEEITSAIYLAPAKPGWLVPWYCASWEMTSAVWREGAESTLVSWTFKGFQRLWKGPECDHKKRSYFSWLSLPLSCA